MFEEIKARSEIMHQALDGLSARQRVISHNLANADTPGYKAREVRFEDTIKSKIRALSGENVDLAQTDPRHISLNQDDQRHYTIHEMMGQMRNDRNGVDMEQEVTRMAHAQMTYAAVSQQLAGSFAGLKYVISEGGRG
ncbi:MAG: flagellar basal body rod protein FlgB [Candidatus Sericytochromatia bacterium]